MRAIRIVMASVVTSDDKSAALASFISQEALLPRRNREIESLCDRAAYQCVDQVDQLELC